MHEALNDSLVDWFTLAGRHDLPWRRTRDPWLVLVSEQMLQQTQVARVIPKFEAFVIRFPTPEACADSAVGEVVTAWSGLGYNRRAVNLHRAATAVRDEHRGVVPDDLDALLALPGVGPYTARAVLAFAFERPVTPLDVNTARPLVRAQGLSTQSEADALVVAAGVHAWSYNEALMDLGATVCLRRSPECHRCPWQATCQWHQAGHPDPDPAAPASRQSRFEGSDRQGRGRLVDALRAAPVPRPDLAASAGWPRDPERAARAAESLVRDGLARWTETDALALA